MRGGTSRWDVEGEPLLINTIVCVVEATPSLNQPLRVQLIFLLQTMGD